jgi:DNA mismatch repair protein MutH
LNKEVEELRQLKQTYEELQVKIKDSAIEAIMEKENELIQLREKAIEMEEVSNVKIESLNREINQLQEKLFKSGVFLRDSNDISFEPSEVFLFFKLIPPLFFFFQ